VVFHLLHRDKGVHIRRALREQVLAEHRPAVRHLVRLVRRQVAVNELDAVLAQEVEQGDRRSRVRGAVAFEDTDLCANELGLGSLSQEAQRGSRDSFADQLLELTLKEHELVWRPRLVELDADAPGFLKPGPGLLQRIRRPFEGGIDLTFASLVIAVDGADTIRGLGSLHGFRFSSWM
jgi:hypothetical protein